MFEVQLLGPLRVRVDGQVLTAPRLRKVPLLLAWLAIHHEANVEYGKLAAVLWPESVSEEEGRDSVRTYLSELREWLGAEKRRLIKEGKSRIRLDVGNASVDANLFEQAVRLGDDESLRQAVRVYGGPFLDGFNDEWIVKQRAHYRGSYLRALEALARQAEDLPTAEHYLSLAAEADGSSSQTESIRLIVGEIRERTVVRSNGAPASPYAPPASQLTISTENQTVASGIGPPATRVVPRRRLGRWKIFAAAGLLLAWAVWSFGLRVNSTSGRIEEVWGPVHPPEVPVFSAEELDPVVDRVESALTAHKTPANADLTKLQDACFAGIFRYKSLSLPSRIKCVACSPAGRQVVGVGVDGSAYVWDEESGKLQHRFSKPGHVATRAWFDDDGRFVTVIAGRKVFVWDARTGTLRCDTPDRGMPVLAARYAGGTCRVAYQRPDRVVIWENRTNTDTVLDEQSGQAVMADFFLDGGAIAVADDMRPIRVWGTDSHGKGSVGPVGRGFDKHHARLTSMTAHNNSVVSCDADGYVCAWSDNGSRTMHTHRSSTGPQVWAANSPIGEVVTVGKDGSVRVDPVTVSTGAIYQLPPTVKAVSASISADGRRLVLARRDGKVEDWRIPIPVFAQHWGPVYFATFSSDGKRIATVVEDVRIWDVTAGRLLLQLGGASGKGHGGKVFHCAFTPDGARVVSAGQETNTNLLLWNLAVPSSLPREDPVQRDGYTRLAGHKEAVNFVAFSPDGKLFATAGWDGTVRVWNPSTGKVAVLNAHEGEARTAYFAPDGKSLLTSSYDGRVLLWKPPYKDPSVLQKFEDPVRCASWSPDGQFIVVALKSQAAWVLDSAGNRITQFPCEATWARFSPDGSRIATAHDDHLVRLWTWNRRSLSQIIAYDGHKSTVWTVEFSPDGRYVVSAGDDGSARIFPASLNVLVDTFRVGKRKAAQKPALQPVR